MQAPDCSGFDRRYAPSIEGDCAVTIRYNGQWNESPLPGGVTWAKSIGSRRLTIAVVAPVKRR